MTELTIIVAFIAIAIMILFSAFLYFKLCKFEEELTEQYHRLVGLPSMSNYSVLTKKLGRLESDLNKLMEHLDLAISETPSVRRVTSLKGTV